MTAIRFASRKRSPPNGERRDALHRQQIVAERAGGEKKLRIGGAHRRRNYADKQQHRGERREKLPQRSKSERLFNISYKRMLRSARHDEERDAQVNPADYIWSYGEQAKSFFFAAAGDYPYRVLGIAATPSPHASIITVPDSAPEIESLPRQNVRSLRSVSRQRRKG